MFHVIVAGSRFFTDYNLLKRKMDILTQNQEKVVVVSGCARGADQLGERWARESGYEVKQFPADWSRHGKRAGFHRNAQMSNYADAVVVFWDGTSRGSKHMIGLAQKKNLPLRVIRF